VKESSLLPDTYSQVQEEQVGRLAIAFLPPVPQLRIKFNLEIFLLQQQLVVKL